MIDSFLRRLGDGEVVLIDGGTGTELEARGVPMHETAWAGAAVLDHQDVVRGVHEDFIRAGAEVIITNTFSSNRLVLEPAGFGDQVVEINRRAARIAREARDTAAERPVLIAGSLSPHGARGVPDPQPDPEFVLSCFREQVAVQAEAGVDLFALEMIPSAYYGRPAAQAAVESGLPVWLGMTTESGDGGFLPEQALAALVDDLVQPGVSAVNVMHTDINDVHPALDQIEREWEGTLGAYAHYGDWIPPNWIFKEITPEQYLVAARTWVERGVQIIGGCCGIRPSHIQRLDEELPKRIPAGARHAR